MFKQTIGFTCGAFDLLHVGHLHFLSECSQRCDRLWVGLHTDPTIDRPEVKNKPAQSSFERYMQLNSLDIVDKVIPYDTEHDLYNMVATLPIGVRFVGDDYYNKSITAFDLCTERSIRVEFIPRMHTYSSSELRERVRQ